MPKFTPVFQRSTSEPMTKNKLLRKFTHCSPVVVIPNNTNINNNDNNSNSNKKTKKNSCTVSCVASSSPDSRRRKRSRLETSIKGLSIKEKKRESEEIKSGQDFLESCQEIEGSEKKADESTEEEDTDKNDASDDYNEYIKTESKYKDHKDDEGDEDNYDDDERSLLIDEDLYELPVTRSASSKLPSAYTNSSENSNNSDNGEQLARRLRRHNNPSEPDSASSSTSKLSNKRQRRRLLENNTNSTCYSDATFCNKSNSNIIKLGTTTTAMTATASTTATLRVTTNTNKRKKTAAITTVNSKKPSWVSYSSTTPLFSECTRHGKTNQRGRQRNDIKGRLCINDIIIKDKVLGEGQIGKVFLAIYKGLPVACKTKRKKADRDNYEYQVLRELTFAAKLSVCKYMNRYVGWFNCQVQKSETNEDLDHENSNNNNNNHNNGNNSNNNTSSSSSSINNNNHNNAEEDNSICIVQRYIPNLDSRKYLYKRTTPFRPYEVLQAAICLFTALKEAHSLGIGIVDLKLENFLIDSAGTGWITDFGSCIEFEGEDAVSLDAMGVTWTTHVAAPEMISRREFRKASDVFMATLIAAELMTGHLTDRGFQDEVLRRQLDGQVNFTSSGLGDKFKAFFPILESGLRNDPEDRSTAEIILKKLIVIRDESYFDTD